MSGRFAYRVCYMAQDEFGAWQTDLHITGLATAETLNEQLQGAYLAASEDEGLVFAVLTLQEGEHFDDEPLHLELVH